MRTTCCISDSTSARTFELSQMCMHNKWTIDIMLWTWSYDLGTINRPTEKWGPDILPLARQVQGPSNFVICVCIKEFRRWRHKKGRVSGWNLQTSYKMRTRLHVSSYIKEGEEFYWESFSSATFHWH